MLKRIRFLSWRLLGEVWWHLLLKEQGEVGQAKGMGQRWQLSPKGTNYQKSWGKREHRMFRQQQVSRQTYLNSKHQKRFFFLIQWGKIFTHFPDSGGIIFFKPYLATFSSLLWQFFVCVCAHFFIHSFKNIYLATVKVKLLIAQSGPTLCDPWTVACQAPLSMEFSRQESWSGLPFSSPGYLPNPGIEHGSSTLQADSLYSEPPGKPLISRHRSHCALYL